MNPNAHIFIYAHKITPRVKYTLNLILKDCLGLEFTLTNNIDDFKAFGKMLWYVNLDAVNKFYNKSYTLENWAQIIKLYIYTLKQKPLNDFSLYLKHSK